MIIKRFEPAESEAFDTIDVLQMNSVELRELYGVWVDDPGARDVDELMATLVAGDPVPPDLRRERLARAAAKLPFLLPCFVARQQRPGREAETFLTDGPPGKWSLFFEEGGAMSLVRCEEGKIELTAQPVLDPEWRPAPRAWRPAGVLGGLKAAQRAFRRRA